jgi:hypothetical protein
VAGVAREAYEADRAADVLATEPGNVCNEKGEEMTRQNVSTIDFCNWVLAQPDDRKVNMGHTKGTDDCGCLMVQYGLEVLKITPHLISCGTKVIMPFYGDTDHTVFLEDSISDMLGNADWGMIRSFGNCKPFIQEYLKSKGRVNQCSTESLLTPLTPVSD